MQSSLGSSSSPPVCWKPRRCLQKSILVRLVLYQEVDSYTEQKDGFGWKSDLCPVTTVPDRLDTQDVKISLCRHHHLFQHRKPMIRKGLPGASPPITTRTERAPDRGETTSATGSAKTTLGWWSGLEWTAVVLSADCEVNLRQAGNA